MGHATKNIIYVMPNKWNNICLRHGHRQVAPVTCTYATCAKLSTNCCCCCACCCTCHNMCPL